MFELAVIAKGTLGTLAVMALHGTALAAVAFGLGRAAGLRPAWQAAVWLVVMTKFALPWSPALPWSLADVVAMLRGESGGFALPGLVPASSGAAAAPALLPALGWLALAAVWLAGIAFVLTRAITAELAARRHARTGLAAPARAAAILVELAARLRVRAPRLVVTRAATGPYVVGVLRPTIVIPVALVDEPPLLQAALAHELAHVRRFDVLARVIQLVAHALLWWWPIVRLANRRLELAREQACDAWALEHTDLARPAYARLLVRMAALPLVATPALAAPRALDARVAAILGPVACARMGLVHRLALVAWVALALGGARTATARGQGEVCVYTPALAEMLIEAHPAADQDGDGTISRDEACDFQAELRKRVADEPRVSEMDPASTELLAEPLCCNCDVSLGRSAPPAASSEPRCFRDEGAY